MEYQQQIKESGFELERPLWKTCQENKRFGDIIPSLRSLDSVW